MLGAGGGGGGPGGAGGARRNARLAPEVNRILYVRNLPYKISNDELYDIFGKYGSLRQIRKGNTAETKGTAFVIYDDLFDAKSAVDHLAVFNVAGRYLVVLYYQAKKFAHKMDLEKQQAEVEELKRRYVKQLDK